MTGPDASRIASSPSSTNWWSCPRYTDELTAVHLLGDWDPARVTSAWHVSTLTQTPDQLAAIDQAWTRACARPGVHLFDGALCRLESLRATGDTLVIGLSATGYKNFLGSNGSHPEWATDYGHHALANALGTSCALVSSDGWLVFGRRGLHLALYPGYPHPVGGTMEIQGADVPDVTTELLREVHEEVGLTSAHIANVRIIGLGEDTRLHQPELIWQVHTTCPRSELEYRIAQDEHMGAWSVLAQPQAIFDAVVPLTDMTPVLRATLLAYGWRLAGDAWLERVRQAMKR